MQKLLKQKTTISYKSLLISVAVIVLVLGILFIGYTRSSFAQTREQAQAQTLKDKAAAEKKAAAKKKAAAAKARAAQEAAHDRAMANNARAKSAADKNAAAKKKAAAAKKKRDLAARDQAQAKTLKDKAAANKKAAAAKQKAADAARDKAIQATIKSKSVADQKAADKVVAQKEKALADYNKVQSARLKEKAAADEKAAAILDKRIAEEANHDKALVSTLKAKSVADQKAAGQTFISSAINNWQSALLSVSKKTPAPLGKDSCLLRGFTWGTNHSAVSSCQPTCRSGAGNFVQDTYSYCSNTVSKTISKTDCAKLGRKWLAYNGCAHATDTTTAALQCSVQTETYTGGKSTNIDYCGGRKAIAAKVRPIAPLSSKPTITLTASGGVSVNGYGTYARDCAKYNNVFAFCRNGYRNKQCIIYVYYRLLKAGYNVRFTNTNGKDVVPKLQQNYGWKVSRTPQAGAVMSMTGTSQPQYGHTAIVEKVNPNGSFVIAESNWPYQGADEHRRTVPASDISARNMTFATKPS